MVVYPWKPRKIKWFKPEHESPVVLQQVFDRKKRQAEKHNGKHSKGHHSEHHPHHATEHLFRHAAVSSHAGYNYAQSLTLPYFNHFQSLGYHRGFTIMYLTVGSQD